MDVTTELKFLSTNQELFDSISLATMFTIKPS